MKWPADKVERRAIETLIPYARNARMHTDGQVAQIAASMREWGWTNPILVDEEGGIIAGHGRVLAARKLGFTDAPVMVAEGWSEAKKRAYCLVDNQLALNASWDVDTLANEVRGLAEWNFDTSLLGFDDLDALLAHGTGRTDSDEAPELPAIPASRVGDLWVLGRHRLLCGDATNADHVGQALGGVKPHLMVTDPPYGVDYDPDWRNRADRANGTPYGARAVGKVTNDNRNDWTSAWILFPGSVVYCWHAGRYASLVQGTLESAGFDIVCQIIWAKDRHIISRGDYHWQHEPCWYAVRKGKRHEWAGDRSQTTLWQVAHNKSETGHSAQKPVECMKRPIENNSSPGQAVYDPFVGSGTTIIAAEMTGRSCHAMDIDPAYVDVAVQRWQNFTGEKATDADGRLFDKISKERLAPPKKRKVKA